MRVLLIGLCFAVFNISSSFGQTSRLNNGLAKLIDSLYTADQNTVVIKPADSAAATYQRVIRTNFPAVSKILSSYGYPGYTLVGQESSKRYFTLVQHSDFSPVFQARALKLMKRQVRKNNAPGQQYAALIDRINIKQGKPQVYGSQVIMSANTQTKPCIDPENLNKRRKSVGLEPIEDYLKKCNEFFYEMNPKERNKKVN